MNICEEMEKRRTRLLGTCTISAFDGMVIVPHIELFRRVLAIGDIHGNLERLLSLFHRMDYCVEDDLLVFLGDYIDRGEYSAECLQYVMKLTEKSSHVIALTGNHEAMMLNYFENHSIRDPMDETHGWLHSGGIQTFESLSRVYWQDSALYHALLSFVLSLNHIAAVGTEYIFTHAGFYPKVPYAKQFDAMLWLREEFYNNYDGEKTVVVGHTPVQFFHKEQTRPIRLQNKIIDCDTGSFLPHGYISCVDVKSMKCWQSAD